MRPRRRICFLIIFAGIPALLSTRLVWTQDSSQARVVRLSYVEGAVTVQRPDVAAWAQAPVNTPLEEGFKLSTGENSFAEVQFENGGTLRLGQLGLLTIKQLGLTAGGGKINDLQLEEGYATFHALGASGVDSYQVGTPYGVLTAEGAAMFRVDLDQGAERVEVFEGIVDVQSNLGSRALPSETVLVLQPGASNPANVSQGITRDDWDNWVDNRESQVETPQTGSLPNGYTGNTSNLVYGWGDLSEYGNWSYISGYGYGWMPASAGGSWSPYGSGQWCWYPGFGYTWISAEPWGWLPFHYGEWDFVPGMGWAWFPENFGGWSPAPVNWYSGPGWIGWTPRVNPGHGRPIHNPCVGGNSCGGAVVSSNTFRNGGLVSASNTMALSPATGERINQPGIQPTTAAMLPGQALSQPPSVTHGPGRTMPARTGAVTLPAGPKGTATPAPATRGAGSLQPGSSIVYDPQAASYVNNPHAAPVQPAAAPKPGMTVTTVPGAVPALMQPVPVGGRDQSDRPVDRGGLLPSDPVGGVRPVQPRPLSYGPGHVNAPPSNPNPQPSAPLHVTASPSPPTPGPSGQAPFHAGGGSESHGGAGLGGAHAGGGGVGGGGGGHGGGGHH